MSPENALFPQNQSFKVFRYSFFGTIPNFLNRLLDSPFLVRWKWNLQYLLVLNWTLAWFTFCENRYFHDNDEQKTSKTWLKLKFSAIQISLWKASTNILNCGVWHTKYTRTKKICMFVLRDFLGFIVLNVVDILVYWTVLTLISRTTMLYLTRWLPSLIETRRIVFEKKFNAFG